MCSIDLYGLGYSNYYKVNVMKISVTRDQVRFSILVLETMCMQTNSLYPLFTNWLAQNIGVDDVMEIHHEQITGADEEEAIKILTEIKWLLESYVPSSMSNDNRQ